MKQSLNMIDGVIYDGVSSKPHPCFVSVNNAGYVNIEGVEHGDIPFNQLRISTRVGHTVRTLYFANGSRFETQNNEAIDEYIALFTKSNGTWLSLHYWESKLSMIVLATVIIGVCVYGFVSFGLPAASKSIANKLPAYVSESLAEEALQGLDSSALEKSKLTRQRQQELRTLFSDYIPDDTEFNYRFLFRSSERFGANAMALPDGTLIFTDELVALANHDDELVAVLLHEIGHVEQRHSLRNVVEATGLYALYTWISGDLEAGSVVILGGSGLLLKAKYSRGHESEADNYSLTRLLENKINPRHFATIMTKLEASQVEQRKAGNTPSDRPSEASKDDNESVNTDDVAKDKNKTKEQPSTKSKRSELSRMLDYLSSHPATEERIARFEKAAKQNGY